MVFKKSLGRIVLSAFLALGGCQKYASKQELAQEKKEDLPLSSFRDSAFMGIVSADFNGDGKTYLSNIRGYNGDLILYKENGSWKYLMLGEILDIDLDENIRNKVLKGIISDLDKKQ